VVAVICGDCRTGKWSLSLSTTKVSSRSGQHSSVSSVRRWVGPSTSIMHLLGGGLLEHTGGDVALQLSRADSACAFCSITVGRRGRSR
jgi:hypothetical protein